MAGCPHYHYDHPSHHHHPFFGQFNLTASRFPTPPDSSYMWTTSQLSGFSLDITTMISNTSTPSLLHFRPPLSSPLWPHFLLITHLIRLYQRHFAWSSFTIYFRPLSSSPLWPHFCLISHSNKIKASLFFTTVTIDNWPTNTPHQALPWINHDNNVSLVLYESTPSHSCYLHSDLGQLTCNPYMALSNNTFTPNLFPYQ